MISIPNKRDVGEKLKYKFFIFQGLFETLICQLFTNVPLYYTVAKLLRNNKCGM